LKRVTVVDVFKFLIQVLQDGYVKSPAANAASNVAAAMPRGRWASRVDDHSVTVKSVLDNSCIQGIQPDVVVFMTSCFCTVYTHISRPHISQPPNFHGKNLYKMYFTHI